MATESTLRSRTDVISDVLAFCPPNNFLFLAGVSKTWQEAWLMTCSRHKTTAISMATSSPARTEWVLDDDMFWLAAAEQEYMEHRTHNNKTSTIASHNNNSSSSIFVLLAVAGNLFGLEAAARKLEWNNSESWSRRSCRHQKGCTSNLFSLGRRRVPEIAAEIGHLEMLKWAVCQEGCPLNPNVWFFAGNRGSLSVLEWLHRRGCPSDLYSCTAGAASGGKLEALKWSRQRGHGWDRFVCFSAARLGNLEMLRWARSQGCPWDKHRCASIAGTHGHRAIVEWVKTHQP